MIATEKIESIISNLPTAAGVYTYKDKKGTPIYVGKAVNLKNRIRSYFRGDVSIKTAMMLRHAADIEYTIVNNEMEALLLEANLIKKHKPRYNILLMDDKHFPYLKITWGEKYPRIVKTRRVVHDGSQYFGPYLDSDLNVILRFINNYFKLRKRPKPMFRDRPCLNYSIGLCYGPCQGLISPKDYKKIVEQVAEFLSGKTYQLSQNIKKQMVAYSQNLEYEKAQEMKVLYNSLQSISEKQVAISTKGENQDMIVAVRESEIKGLVKIEDSPVLSKDHDEYLAIIRLTVRDGKLINKDAVLLTGYSIEEGLESYISQYYLKVYSQVSDDMPDSIVLSRPIDDIGCIVEYFADKGKKVKIVNPKGARLRQFADIAVANAKDMIEQKRYQYMLTGKA